MICIFAKPYGTFVGCSAHHNFSQPLCAVNADVPICTHNCAMHCCFDHELGSPIWKLQLAVVSDVLIIWGQIWGQRNIETEVSQSTETLPHVLFPIK